MREQPTAHSVAPTKAHRFITRRNMRRVRPLDRPISQAPGLILAMAHAVFGQGDVRGTAGYQKPLIEQLIKFSTCRKTLETSLTRNRRNLLQTRKTLSRGTVSQHAGARLQNCCTSKQLIIRRIVFHHHGHLPSNKPDANPGRGAHAQPHARTPTQLRKLTQPSRATEIRSRAACHH